jgi:phosphatidylglycerol:prolipoprotein diacylglycerol transferase
VPIAVIALDFDPILRLGDVAVRLQVVALAAAVLLALLVGARGTHRFGLRVDDLLFVTVGIVPGAVIGGRAGYVLGHLDYYADRPAAIVDPGQGALTLGLAVAGGVLTGAVVVRLLGTSIRQWLHVATVPTLIVLGLGKLVMVLGGAGQGLPTDAPWATAYGGDGPWGSLAPEIPSHPAQLYEAGAVLLAAAIVGIVAAAGAFRARDGRAFFVAIAAWTVGRVAVGSVWRDAPVAGPFRAEQLIALGLAVASLIAIVVIARMRRAPAGPARADRATQLEWPDPATRPRF